MKMLTKFRQWLDKWPSYEGRDCNRMYGRWRVRYNDGLLSERMCHSVAQEYASIFGGTVEHLGKIKNMKTRFVVNQNRIKCGVRGHARMCPVALAVNARLKPRYRSKVYGGGSNGIMIFDRDYDREFCAVEGPEKVETFTTDFDHDRKTAPFQFTLDIPKKYLK